MAMMFCPRRSRTISLNIIVWNNNGRILHPVPAMRKRTPRSNVVILAVANHQTAMAMLVVIVERMENLVEVSPSLKRENAVDLARIMLATMIKRNNLVLMTLAGFALKGDIGRGIV